MSSKSTTNSQSTSSNTVNPHQMQQFQDNINNVQANGSSFTSPFTGEMVAALTPQQLQAEQQLTGVATDPTYTNNISGATSAVQGILGNLPSGQVNATPVNATTIAGTDLTPYLNPYQQDVINSTMTQLGQQRGAAINSDNQAAIAAKAFGNSRAGVNTALTNQYYDQDAASTLAGLNTNNFTNAEQMAAQDAATKNQVGEFNSGQDLTAQQDSVQNKINSGVLGINAADAVNNLTNSNFDLAANQGGILGNVGQQQQTQQQNQDTAAMQAWLEGKELTAEQQQMVNQALGIMPVEQTVNQNGTSTTSTNSGISGILGSLGSLGMAAAMPGSGGLFGSTSLLGNLFGGSTAMNPLSFVNQG
jgi:hypothetical protein